MVVSLSAEAAIPVMTRGENLRVIPCTRELGGCAMIAYTTLRKEIPVTTTNFTNERDAVEQGEPWMRELFKMSAGVGAR
jgi:hypothetical protein